MNTKTTLALVLIAVAVAGYLLLVEKPWTAAPPESEEATKVVRDLFASKPENVDRVELRLRDGKSFVFAKKDDAWWIQSPMECPANDYEIDGLIRNAGEIKVVRRYAQGDADRPSAEITGLESPIAAVKLLSKDKVLGEVLVGSRIPAGKGSFVQLAGAPDIFESQSDLSETFRKKLESFRNRNVIRFTSANARRIVVEGGQNFTLVKSGDGWVIEEPAALRGQADKSRADRIVNALSSLYVSDFKDDEPVSYRPYGLEPPRLKVTIETEEERPPKAKPGDPDTQPADTQPSIEKRSYVLAIGGAVDNEAKQLFARANEAPWVFTIGDYTYKEVSPKLAELRDPVVARIETGRARQIVVTGPEGSMTLRREAGQWTFEDGTAADAVAVQDLLKAVADLKASDYPDPSALLVPVDWSNPRVRIEVTQEGRLEPVALLIGPPSASGEMVYVRNAAEAEQVVAAARKADVEPLLVSPSAFRDRKVLSFERGRLSRIEIARAGSDRLALVKAEGKWSIVEPVQADADADAVRNIIDDFSSLQARRVTGHSDRATCGLDAPEVTLALYVAPLQPPTPPPATLPATAPASPASAPSPTQPTASEPAEVESLKNLTPEERADRIAKIEQLLEFQKTNPQENPQATQMLRDMLAQLQAASQPGAEGTPAGEPQAAPQPTPEPPPAPAETVFRVHLTRKDGKVFACVDGSDTIYELDERIFTDVSAEMHDRQVVKLQADKVVELSMGAGEEPLAFRKSGTDWRYVPDPLVPIDGSKVTEAINEWQDVKTHRYVAYAAADLAAFGLDAQARRFSVRLEDGEEIELLISAKGPEGDPDKSLYAARAGTNKVFLVKGDQAAKLDKRLDFFKKN